VNQLAETKAAKAGISKDEASPSITRGVAAALCAWIVPGLGHAMLRRWSKAIAYFFAVGVLAVVGLAMRGDVLPESSQDAFDRLGFVADLGTGGYYFFSKTLEPSGSDDSKAAGDYGTRIFAAAGVLNFLIILEAYEIGRRNRVAADREAN
jgi:drug/metabolite transporter (DMT)-like permease